MSSKTGNLLFPTAPPLYDPPPGPPPSHPPDPERGAGVEELPSPPPYHDWTSVPDTALLPPPPGLSHASSPGFNASRDEAERAKQWCYFHPLWPAQALLPAQLSRIRQRDLSLLAPGAAPSLRKLGPGRWLCQTARGATDALVHTDLPLYSACADSPSTTGRPATLYFEVKIVRLGAARVQPGTQAGGARPRPALFSLRKRAKGRAAAAAAGDGDGTGSGEHGLALGFFAAPYPPFRLPGWQRGSLGVHSDDGRRYVNDTHGGMDFTSPFGEGETLGLGLRLRPRSCPSERPAGGPGSDALPGYSASPAATPAGEMLDATVFLTREGQEVGSWNLHEERDLEDDPHGVEGLEGAHDLFPGIGVFGAVAWELRLKQEDWLWRP